MKIIYSYTCTIKPSVAKMRIAVDVIFIDAESHLIARIFELIIQLVDIGCKNPLLPVVICDLDCYIVFFVLFCTSDASKQAH